MLCEDCGYTGAVKVPALVKPVCPCILHKNLASDVPVRYVGALLSMVPDDNLILDALKSFNESWSLTFIGPCGTGKSFLGCCLLNQFGGWFVACNPIDPEEKEWRHYRGYSQLSARMMDDIGPNERNTELVSQWVEKFYNRKYRLIVTINDWNVLSERAKSRLNEGAVIEIKQNKLRDNPSYLEKLKENQRKILSDWQTYYDSVHPKKPSMREMADKIRKARTA